MDELETLDAQTGQINSLPALREFITRLHDAWNDDPEVAHSLADEIKTRALQLVADGHPDAAVIAREVLVIDTWTDVDRWYA